MEAMPPPVAPRVPGKVQAIGAMHLIGGILNLILALVWGLNGIFGIFYVVGVVMCCPALLLIPIGALEIYSGVKHLSSNHAGLEPPRMVAYAELASILGCGTMSMISGVLTLVFLNDPEVVAYYEQRRLTG